MNVLALLRDRFAAALAPLTDEMAGLIEMVKPSQDPKFGDYQANCAMPLGKRLGKSPRDVAGQIVEALDVADFCEKPEIAGPGFINLRLKDDWLAAELKGVVLDERLGITAVESPRTFVIDFSAPNVAKPMHVGHIRSTVIGDALSRTLRFLGHRVISDNHIGDWGTQFGMILYGYKHFVDATAFEKNPVDELARLYRLVNRLVTYHKGRRDLPQRKDRAADLESQLAEHQAADPPNDPKLAKKEAKLTRRMESQVHEARAALKRLEEELSAVEAEEELSEFAREHPDIDREVLDETALLHAGDADNLRLWRAFMPYCMQDIERIYRRLGVSFDHTLGESFYHDRLATVVADFLERGIATESDSAICIFLDGFDTPMIIRKQDGAFLYATSDLATIQYRIESWQPDAILYVVDHRQSEHFGKLFAAARRWGFDGVDFEHVRFGTVLGEDGRPFKTRSGQTVGLEGLLDEAIQKAHLVVSQNDDSKPGGAELDDDQRRRVAEVVGIAALKYADLAQNRESDYVFSYEKMLALNGNTATYMQYAYARVQSILRKSGVNLGELRASGVRIALAEPAERALGVAILRFAEAVADVIVEYRPNQLTNYLFEELAKRFSTFFEKCPVIQAADEEVRSSRLLLCDLTARTIRTGLELLGIDVVEKM